MKYNIFTNTNKYYNMVSKHTIYILAIIVLLSSCKKMRSKDTLTVDVTCVNPVDGSAFPGVVYTIYEVKDKFSVGLNTNQKKELIYTGETDINGKAYYEFDAIKNSKFSYEIYFDYSEMDVPDGEYYLNKTRDFDYLKKNEANVYHFDILPMGKYVQHIKNINCQGPNDKMRFRVKYPFTGSGNWSSWGTSDNDYLFGCYNSISEVVTEPSDYRIYEVEVTRNNVITTFIDTFYIDPTFTDTLKLYY